jgi:hypothetical protein
LVCAIIGAAIFATLGPFTIFAASALIAGILRLWMLTSDISLVGIGKIFGALLLVSFGIGWVVRLFRPEADVVVIALPTLLFLILMGVILRAFSFFFGRYFGVCRRAALQKAIATPDSGGYVDLGFAVVLALIAGGPLALTALIAALAATPDGLPAGLSAVLIAMGATSLLWGYFYLPMGIAAVALRGSLNPMIVLSWIGRTFADYICLLLLLLPFHLAIWIISAVVSLALPRVTDLAPFLGAVLTLLYAVVFTTMTDQYAAVATMTALGLVLRRHEEDIGWLRHAKRLDAVRDTG